MGGRPQRHRVLVKLSSIIRWLLIKELGVDYEDRNHFKITKFIIHHYSLFKSLRHC